MRFLSEILLNDSFLFSNKTTIYNKSKIKKNKIICIIGLSGSGKSTLAKKLNKCFKC
jgi:ABC-type proline/glycine betaine transport system ATPase subunit